MENRLKRYFYDWNITLERIKDKTEEKFSVLPFDLKRSEWDFAGILVYSVHKLRK